MKHGYLTIAAMLLQTILVFVVMVPGVLRGSGAILSLSPEYAVNTWLHFGLGIVAMVLGFWFVGLWVFFSHLKMQCLVVKRYMMPALIIWIIAIATGALIHLLQMF
ncbi:MAG TPA: hypothetical protein VLU95_04565 [Candidatus Acidoferrum sp.]|nr:hypothetical protein [Candidatus Acidoferrum sp.]